VFFWIPYNVTDLFDDNWQHAKAWIILFVRAVKMNPLSQRVLCSESLSGVDQTFQPSN